MPRILEKNMNDPNRLQTPIQDYLNCREFMQDRLWTLTPKGWVTKFNGKVMSAESFNKKFPIPQPVAFGRCNQNPDTTRRWMNQ